MLLITKKESDRFFGDRRMLVNALILPGLLLYVIYAFVMPPLMGLMIGRDDEAAVFAVNAPDSMEMFFEQIPISFVRISEDEMTDVMDGIAEGGSNFLLVFPADFDAQVAAFDIRSGEDAPEIRLYYNSTVDGHAISSSMIHSALSAFERSIARGFDINLTGDGDLAAEGETGRNMFALLLPMLLLTFVYSAAISSATESITGEKERGTLSTILVTPITPLELASGKILGLSLQAFLCGISGTLGIVLALPRFVRGISAQFGAEEEAVQASGMGAMNMGRYGIFDAVALFFLLLSCALFIVAIVSLVAAQAKTVKEAQMILSPMMIVVMITCMAAAFIDQRGFLQGLIPIFNSVQSINDILNRSHTVFQVCVSIASNIAFAALGTVALARMFASEKVLSAN
ncbi:MAG: ABC transporter permease [Treponema sp.]|nr:ABC transporter permease [Treponema sp.]